jgi:hypothetical protein
MISFELRSCPSGLHIALVGRLVSPEKVLIKPIQPYSGCFSNAQHYWGHETSEPFSLTSRFALIGWMRWRDTKRGIALFFDRDRNWLQLFQCIWWHLQYVEMDDPRLWGIWVSINVHDYKICGHVWMPDAHANVICDSFYPTSRLICKRQAHGRVQKGPEL